MKIYLVGGAVRDTLLQLPVVERDWVVVGSTPEELIKLGYQQVGGHFPVFLHPKTHEEYALARTERKDGHGYQGFSCHFSPDIRLEEDLLRRDLTINAIAIDDQEQLIDPYHGQTDIKLKLLRHVSPAFTEDPLRVLRVARFHAKFYHLGFEVAPETLTLMQTIVASNELAYLSVERIWAEWTKALATDNPSIFIKTLKVCGALEKIAPELNNAPIISKLKNPYHGFVLLCQNLSIAQYQAFTQRLKTPKFLQDLGVKYLKFKVFIHEHSMQSPKVLLELFKKMDAFRQQAIFLECLDCAIESNLIQKNTATRWEKIIQECQQLKLPKRLQGTTDIARIHQYFDNERLNIIVKH